MPTRREVVGDQLGELKQDLRDLWVALTADPVKQARKERIWSIFAGGLGAVATIASRALLTRLWPVLTGEPAPLGRPTGAPAALERELRAATGTLAGAAGDEAETAEIP